MGILWRRLCALLRPIFAPSKLVFASAGSDCTDPENSSESQAKEQIENNSSETKQADSDCDCLPLIIPDTEIIIRAIYYFVHVNKNGKLKWQAFQPTGMTDEISVMRGGCMPPTACKQKAKEFQRPGNKIYQGLAALSTGAVRLKGYEVVDSRKYYCGHGHISIGIGNVPTAVQEPSTPEATERIREIAKELIKLASYNKDTNPEADHWPEEIPLTPP